MTIVAVDAPWGTTSGQGFSAEIRVEPHGKWLPINHGVKPVVVKQRPVNGSAPLVDGWREPTVFRAFVSKNDCSGVFDYTCFTGGVKKRHRGNNYPHSTTHIYCGTQGAARYPINTGMDDAARTNALAKANRSEFQVGVFVAELTATVTMLGKSLRELRHYMEKANSFLENSLRRKIKAEKPMLLRDRVRKEARARARLALQTPATSQGKRKLISLLGKELASRWLEFQYGWKPLLSDIYGIAGLIEEQLQRRLTVKSVANPSERVAPSLPFTPVNGGIMIVEDQVITGAKCRMDFVIENAVAAQFNRMGLANIIEVAWELIPFSFVFDWIVPIGKFLGALTGSWGMRYLGGSITRYTTASVNVRWTQYHYIDGEPISYNIRSVSTFRYPISDLTPRLYVKNPLNSVSRTITALALLTTSLLSKKG